MSDLKNTPLKISNVTIQPGERITLALPTPEIYTFAPMYIPIHIIHGKRTGPTLLVCGTLHGDEINGVAISQKLLNLRLLKSLKGTLIVIPAINVYGMMTLSRNLPDRRDLEGNFPGSKTGSFASRLAYLLREEIFSHITHCIDLHTGESNIVKFPQVKTSLENEENRSLAKAFNAPVMLDVPPEQGLLWLSKQDERPIPTIIYEVGEGLRLDAQGIKIGVNGVVRVMKTLNMIKDTAKQKKTHGSIPLEKAHMVRASFSGLSELFAKVGSFVSKGDKVAKITDPFGTEQRGEVLAPCSGVVIAKNNLPILNEGEPILQIAEMKQTSIDKIQSWTDEGKEGVKFEPF